MQRNDIPEKVALPCLGFVTRHRNGYRIKSAFPYFPPGVMDWCSKAMLRQLALLPLS